MIISVMISVLYFIILIFLTIYSYTQVDLNLTISSIPLFQSFQKPLINLGFFNRPLSSLFFLIITSFLFLIYGYYLLRLKKDTLMQSKIWWVIIISSAILFFSYPAFSHDFFNYLFDARIVTKYFANPYFQKALDYPLDPWIRFMHWTHRTYPYGPLWLLITLPFSFLGFGKFVVTMFLFKFMFVLFYLGNCYLIDKLAQEINHDQKKFALVFFALNPLILIESLVSPHNESVMLFFLLLSLYYLFLYKRKILSLFFFIFSIGIKFITAIILPLFFIDKFRKMDYQWFIKFTFWLLLIPILIEIYYREAYPWYFMLIIPIASLINGMNLLLIIFLSLGLLLRYLPYLYFGEYNEETAFLQNILLLIPLIIGIISILINKIKIIIIPRHTS